MTSVSSIVLERFVNMLTNKDDFTTKCIVLAAIFEDSVSRVIPVHVAVDKINKMAESGSPRLRENESRHEKKDKTKTLTDK